MPGNAPSPRAKVRFAGERCADVDGFSLRLKSGVRDECMAENVDSHRPTPTSMTTRTDGSSKMPSSRRDKIEIRART